MESGLDFAQARYYNSTHGRYTSIDPLTASASIRNPQTFNRYSYVLNSPYKYTDPLGLMALDAACGGSCPGSFMGIEGDGYFSSKHGDVWKKQQAEEVESPPQNIEEAKVIMFSVEGTTYDEAMANAAAYIAKKFPKNAAACEGGCIGVTDPGSQSTTVPFSYSGPTKDGTVTVTTGILKGVDTVTIYLPVWNGKGSEKASTEDKQRFSDTITKLKDHEKGHVRIYREEWAKTLASMPTIPKTFSFTVKRSSEIRPKIASVLQSANKLLKDRFDARDRRTSVYDKNTRHGIIDRKDIGEY